MVETLTSLFGFSVEAANEAVNMVGATDIQQCCDFILDQGLGVDGGGAIAPKDDCPHLASMATEIPATIFQSPCHYHDESQQKKSSLASTPVGRPKDDVDEATGQCPMGENWLCLTCQNVYCSRYVNGHGLWHWQYTKSSSDHDNTNAGHCVMVSLADLSVWCHVCGAYIVHETLKPITKRLEQIKFGEAEENEKASQKAKSEEA